MGHLDEALNTGDPDILEAAVRKGLRQVCVARSEGGLYVECVCVCLLWACVFVRVCKCLYVCACVCHGRCCDCGSWRVRGSGVFIRLCVRVRVSVRVSAYCACVCACLYVCLWWFLPLEEGSLPRPNRSFGGLQSDLAIIEALIHHPIPSAQIEGTRTKSRGYRNIWFLGQPASLKR